MRLRDYLTDTQRAETVYERFERFGRQLGVSMDCVRKWAYGSRRINDAMKVRIEKITNGRVTIEDMARSKR